MVETSFFELRTKTVINVCDGSSLGHICDIVLEICSGRLLGFVVPCNRSFFGFFRGGKDLYIPYQNVCKIGKDVILVEINYTECRNFNACTFSDVSSVVTLDGKDEVSTLHTDSKK